MAPDLLDKAPSVEELYREVSRIKTVVSEAVEDGVKAAVKAIKQGRHAAEDTLDDAKHTIKQKPFEAVGIVFAVGVLIGAGLTWVGSRRR
jgi:ElaB/YqjD/DUF883 family membrane-anchored ribosome-binding protein